jgi:hypothetical protein
MRQASEITATTITFGGTTRMERMGTAAPTANVAAEASAA